MASYAMVLGVKAGAPSLIGKPGDLSAVKKAFVSIVQDGGVSGSTSFDEVWLVDTAQGRLRRKAFCQAPLAPSERKPKR